MSSDNVDSLTKPKKNKKVNIEISEAVVATPVQDVVPVSAPIPVPETPPTKVKKPRSQAQIDAFARTAAIRKENIAKTTKEKQLLKAQSVLAAHQASVPVTAPVALPAVPQPIQKVKETIDEVVDSDIDVEVKVARPKTVKKKPKYRIVIDSSSDEDAESEDEAPAPIKQKVSERNFSSQQNKKSKISVNHTPTNVDGFFCD